jgi:acyl-coenzyme A synthetase/AMP-(fatty) acid ligase
LNKTLLHFIDENYSNYLDDLIIIDSVQKYTWLDLGKKVDEILKLFESKENNFICFYCDHNFSSIAIIISCMKANKTFIPIARDLPAARIEGILGALGSNEIFDGTTLKFNQVKIPQATLNNKVENNTLYVLFTSGSTGVPKGVQISNANLLNTIEWSQKYFDWIENDVIGVATSLNFDISLFDVFIGLTQNVKLCLLPQSKNVSEVFSAIKLHNVSSIFSTPALFSSMIRLLNNLEINGCKMRRIISGGDFFPPKDLINWFETTRGIEIFNVWGPTETSIVNSAHKIDKSDIDNLKQGEQISIGTFTDQMDLRILEHNGAISQKNPESTLLGEIVVIGKSVGLGYVDKLEESQKNFFIHENAPAYLTGDIGYFKNSKLFMVGRSAFLLKYQGYRIDPREIEFSLLQFPEILNSCALLIQNKLAQNEISLLVELDKRLNSEISEFTIKQHLRTKLPIYMIPKKILFIEKIPLNENGKIDRKKCQALFSNPII